MFGVNCPTPDRCQDFLQFSWIGSPGGGFAWTIYEWNDVPIFGDDSQRYSFQVWIQNDNSGNIWFTYGALGDNSYASVGAENADGSIGESYYFSGDGTGTAPGEELFISAIPGGTATFTFEAEVDGCSSGTVIVNDAEMSADNADERAIAATSCN